MFNESLLIYIGLEQEDKVFLSHINLLNLQGLVRGTGPFSFLLVSDMLTATGQLASVC